MTTKAWDHDPKNEHESSMSSEPKKNGIDEKQFKAEVDKLVRGGMNYMADRIANLIQKILDETTFESDEERNKSDYLRGLSVAQQIARSQIKPDQVKLIQSIVSKPLGGNNMDNKINRCTGCGKQIYDVITCEVCRDRRKAPQ